jgi:hypothetical protein
MHLLSAGGEQLGQWVSCMFSGLCELDTIDYRLMLIQPGTGHWWIVYISRLLALGKFTSLLPRLLSNVAHQIFWLALILEGLLTVMAIFLFRSIEAPSREQFLTLKQIIERSNPVGTGLSIPGLIILVYALTSGNEVGWSEGSVIGTLVAAAVLLVSFGYAEAKLAKYPFVPRHLWKTSDLSLGCVLAAITYAVWQGANYYLTLQLQGKFLQKKKKNSCL